MGRFLDDMDKPRFDRSLHRSTPGAHGPANRLRRTSRETGRRGPAALTLAITVVAIVFAGWASLAEDVAPTGGTDSANPGHLAVSRSVLPVEFSGGGLIPFDSPAMHAAEAGERPPAPLSRGISPGGLATKGDPGSGWIGDRLVERMAGPSGSPAIAAGPNSFLHAVWTQDAGGGDQNVYYASSSDYGLTWGTPVSVASSIAGINAENPDIYVHPTTGRIFIAYVQRDVGTNARSVWVAYSDDRVNWQLQEVQASPVNPGPPKVVTDRGPPYHVYVAYEHVVNSSESDLYVRWANSTDLAAWSTLKCLGCVADASVYADPDIAFQIGVDGHPRVFVPFVTGLDDPRSVEVYWYDEGTGAQSTATIRDESPTLTTSPTIAASRNGDTLLVAWIRHDAGDAVLRWAYQTNPGTPFSAWTLGTPDINTVGVNDFEPRLAADGEGGADDTIAGDYHLTYHHTTPLGLNAMEHRSIPTALTSGWSAASSPGDGSRYGARSGVATQLRSGRWYPAILYQDFLPVVPPDARSDIYYVTPGGVRVETNPSGLSFLCCNATATSYSSPHTFTDWIAGTGRVLDVASPQPGPVDTRYAYQNWSDDGPRRHTVVTNLTFPYPEPVITANFRTEYQVTVASDPPGLTILVDNQVVTTPDAFWWEQGSTHQVAAHEVTNDLEFNGWADAAPRDRTVSVTGAATYTARYARAPFPIALVGGIVIAVAVVLAVVLLLKRRKVGRGKEVQPLTPPPAGGGLPADWREEPEVGPQTEEVEGMEPEETQAGTEPEPTLAVQESRVDEIAARMAELDQMKAEGIITEAEYMEKRKQVLERL